MPQPEKLPPPDDLIRLSRVKSVWTQFKTEHPDSRSGINFDPRSEEEKRFPWGGIHLKGVFYITEVKSGGIVFPATIRSFPITLKETWSILRHYQVSMPNFFQALPENYSYYKTSLREFEERLVEVGESDSWDKQHTLKFQAEYNQELTMLEPYKQKADALVVELVTEAEKRNVDDILTKDYQEVLEATLNMTESGIDPFLPEQYHPNKVFLLSRLRLYAEHASKDQTTHIAAITETVIKEQVEAAKQRLSKEDEYAAISAINILSEVLEDAQVLKIDLSGFKNAARQTIDKDLVSLRETIEREEMEAKKDFLTRLMSSSIYQTLMVAATGEVDNKTSSFENRVNKIIKKTSLAEYSDQERTYLDEEIKAIMDRFHKIKPLPGWKVWLGKQIFKVFNLLG